MCRCNSWSWEIHLRRRLFDWEVPSWNELLALLSSFHSSRLGRDWLQWIGSSDGIYSIKAMKAQLYSSHSSVVNWEKVVWNGLAPPKVEAFMWLILHERVPVKMELLKRGVSGVADDICPFCKLERETAEHLCFTCSVSWQLWNSIARCWDVPLFCIGTPDSVQLAFNTKLRAAWWWKALNYDSRIHMDSIISDLSVVSSLGEASPMSHANSV
ncbi:hypothetical protein V6N13_117104 [Hibiscus sabdariffa]